MEPEGSLSCLQEITTGAYPETDELSPNHQALIFKNSF